MFDMVSDLLVVKQIPKETTRAVVEAQQQMLLQYIYEGFKSGQPEVLVDMGYGRLSAFLEQGELCLRLTPTKDFNKKVKEGLRHSHSPLQQDLEKALSSTILKTYKDLF